MEIATRLKMNVKEQTEIILDNFTKMLFRRKLIKNQSSLFSKLKDINNKGIYSFKENDTDFLLILTFQKLNGIKKGSEIEEQLIKSKGYSFVVASSASNKTYQQVNDFKGELFLTLEFLSDIPSSPFIPEHILLNQKEKEEIYNVYKEKNIAKIFVTDMMARYLGAKKGDLIKIIRKTLNTGESIYYRRVV